MQKVPMTKLGADLLRDELDKRKTQDRPRIVAAISEARAHGDLKENAEYHAAKEQQSFNEGRIAEIEGKLSRVEIIDVTHIENTGRVIFGSTVDLVNIETDEEVKYKIVGDDEADLKHGKISYTSPIARALIGKLEGDEIEFQAPAGIVHYEILKVEYIE